MANRHAWTRRIGPAERNGRKRRLSNDAPIVNIATNEGHGSADKRLDDAGS